MVAPLRAAEFLSHAPQRPLPQPSTRPITAGPGLFVDAKNGNDANNGSKERPWQTLRHAMKLLSAGDTLYLRAGIYYENVYCAIAGTPEKPITIRSFPGEVATIDGGFPEFQQDPETAWEPVTDGVAGEYRSTRIYKNVRDVLGRFADSNVGLQTYWYRMDMQAENEMWIPNPEKFIEPMYCGPGLFYDKQTGRIHVRLAHTKVEFPESAHYKLDQYQGETDPRKLALDIAPYDATPLFLDQAMYVHFQDLAIRGAGRVALNMMFGVGITFDRCTIYAGNYGISSKSTGPLTMTNCGIYGMIAPWMFRCENVSYAYSAKVYPPFIGEVTQVEIAGAGKLQPKQVVRHISRMPTHAIMATEGGYEFETFYHPHNHDWEISYCDFADSHDGPYISGRDIRFHHNLVDNMQDDGTYVSSPTPYFSDGIYVYQNLIRQAVDGFGAHARGGPGGKIYLYRNVIDLRARLQFDRPSKAHPEGQLITGHGAWLVHNPDHIIHMENIYMYQNTVIGQVDHMYGSYCSGMVFHFSPDAERRVFNNLYVYEGGIKQYPIAFGYKRDKANLAFDANLHWNPDPSVKIPKDYFKTSQTHPLSEANKKIYPDGWDAHSILADPKFVSFDSDPNKNLDLRLQATSPAAHAGIILPADWPDPLRPKVDEHPDIGALPAGLEPLRVGIDGRTEAGTVR